MTADGLAVLAVYGGTAVLAPAVLLWGAFTIGRRWGFGAGWAACAAAREAMWDEVHRATLGRSSDDLLDEWVRLSVTAGIEAIEQANALDAMARDLPDLPDLPDDGA